MKKKPNRYVNSAIIAHRGASHYAPENTLAAMRLAKALGAEWVEVDVALTLDRQFVLLHDDDVDRTTNGSGNVFELSLAELKQLDAGGWFSAEFRNERIPTLNELVNLLIELDLKLQLELKPSLGNDEELAHRVLDHFNQIWPADKLDSIFITSFSPICVQIARQKCPTIPCAIAVEHIPDNPQQLLASADAQILHVLDVDFALSDYKKLGDSGVEFAVAIVNDAARAQALLAVGCQSIITDKPDLLGKSASI